MDTTSFFSKATRWFMYGGGFQLRPYEQTCLEAWRKILSKEAVDLLNAQLEHLTVYQRYGNDKLLCFYDTEDKACSSWPKEILFPCQIQEVAVARLLAAPAETNFKGDIKVEIKLSRGRFFGLEFSKPPKPLHAGARIESVRVLFDPMTPITGDIAAAVQLTDFLDTIDAKVPQQYLDLVGGGKEAVFNGWKINGFAEIRKIVWLDHNYYVLVEKEGQGAVAIAEDDRSGHLYYLDYEDELPEKIGVRLRTFLDMR